MAEGDLLLRSCGGLAAHMFGRALGHKHQRGVLIGRRLNPEFVSIKGQLTTLVISVLFMKPALAWLAQRGAVRANPALIGLASASVEGPPDGGAE